MNGATLYRGKSEFNGDPIVVKMSGTRKPSANPKTGKCVQTVYLPDRVDAVRALKDDGDLAVCGTACMFRGGTDPKTGEVRKRTCYVNPMFVNTLAKQDYPRSEPGETRYGKGNDGFLRIAAYGSPASAPYWVTERVRTAHNGPAAGYFAEWRDSKFKAFGDLCMASVVSESAAREAWDLGFRTFRVLGDGEEATEHEVLCPNVTHGVQCKDCGLCSGNTIGAKSVAVPVHGGGAKSFTMIRDRFLKGAIMV